MSGLSLILQRDDGLKCSSKGSHFVPPHLAKLVCSLLNYIIRNWWLLLFGDCRRSDSHHGWICHSFNLGIVHRLLISFHKIIHALLEVAQALHRLLLSFSKVRVYVLELHFRLRNTINA